MNWPRIILDGISKSLLLNAVVDVGFLLWAQAYSAMLPKEIRRAAAPFMDQGDVWKMEMIVNGFAFTCDPKGFRVLNLNLPR